jgi:hypothetical protein
VVRRTRKSRRKVEAATALFRRLLTAVTVYGRGSIGWQRYGNPSGRGLSGWAAEQPDQPGRFEAIGRLVEIGLRAKEK